MESNAFTSDTTLQRSNSSGSSSPSSSSSSSSSSSNDSYVNDASLKTHNLEVNKPISIGNSGWIGEGDDGSENDGFVSGEEEFESAPDRPDEENLGKSVEGGFDSPVVGSSKISTPSVRPVAKVSEDGDDFEDVLEDLEVGVLTGEDVGGSEGVAGNEFSGDKVVGKVDSGENMGTLDGGFEESEVSRGKDLGENENLSELVSEIGVSDTQEGKVVGNYGDNGSVVEESHIVEKEISERGNLGSEKDVEVLKHEILEENSTGAAVEAGAILGDRQSLLGEKEIVEGVNLEDEKGVEDLKHEVLEAELTGVAVEDDATPGDQKSHLGEKQTVDAVEGTKLEDENDVEDIKQEVLEAKLTGTEVDGGAVEGKLADINLIEKDSNKLSPLADSAVETYSLGLESAEDIKDSDTVIKEVLVGGVNLDNGLEESVTEIKDSDTITKEVLVEGVKFEKGSDPASHDAGEPGSYIPVAVDSEPENNVQPVLSNEVRTEVKESGEQKITVAGLVTDQNIVREEVEGQEVEKTIAALSGEGETVGLVAEKEITENEIEADSEGIPKEPVIETAEPGSVLDKEVGSEKLNADEVEIEGSVTDEDNDGIVFGSSEAARQFLEELEKRSGIGSHSGAESSRDHSQRIDGQIVTDSDEEVETDEEEGDGKELFDSAALAALLKAARGASSDDGPITITSQDGSRLFSVERPAGLGSSLPSMKPAPRQNRRNPFTPSNLPTGGKAETNLSEEEKKKLENLQQIRVTFLRLVHRLGVSPEDSLAAQVLYRIGLFAGRSNSHLFSLDTAKSTAVQLEEERREDLDFSFTILVLGKTGVGKSATINSIFGEQKTSIDPFGPSTTTIKEIVGMVDGVKIRVFDTPGLKSSAAEQSVNRKILTSIKKTTKKCPPDIILYVDRMDTQTRDLNDLPLLKSISSALGSSIWRGAIVTLTHAASAPPDGPSGSPVGYEMLVAQRSHVLQQAIGQAAGDMRLLNPTSMNPVSLVENHPSCRKNRDGQKVLPNGQTWRPQLLLLCFSVKILAEVSNFSKPQDSFDHRKLFGFRARSPPLPYLLSGLLQSRTHPKLASDQGGDNGDSDIDLAYSSDSDDEEEDDGYDQLPPFKPLRKSQIAKLSKEQKKAYFEEYDYRVKLLQKKQLRDELKRMREMKKKGKANTEEFNYMGEEDPENGSPAAVQVPLPDMVLPTSFDGDNPAYRYRFLEPTSQFLARPVLDTHGWDHDCGYDGVNVENSLAIASRFPAALAVQITKDKKEFNIHLDSSISAKHGENGSTMAGFDIQNVGRQLAYILRGETKFKNFKKNKTAAGISVTFLGENVCPGVKIEDQIAIGKRLVLVGSTGTVRSQGDSAFGANLEVRLREADYPIGQDQSSLGLSLVKWRGDMALGANLQSQFSIGRNYKMAVRAGLNNKMSGQISVRTSSSDQFQIALLAILPIARTIYKNFFPGVAESYSIY